MKYLSLFFLCAFMAVSCDCIESPSEENERFAGEYQLATRSDTDIQTIRCQSIFDFTDCEDIIDWDECNFNLTGTLSIYPDGSFTRNYHISFPNFFNINFTETDKGFLSDLNDDKTVNTPCCYNQSNDDCEDILLSFIDQLLEWEIIDGDCDYVFQWQKEE